MVKLSVSIDVPDLSKAVAFYVNALDCKKIRDQGDTMIVLSAGNADIYLQERVEGSISVRETDIARDYQRHWTPVHLDFLIENVKNVVSRVLDYGGKHEGGESGDWGSIAYCVDPFGNGFCVINE